jgi:hypothetical protein
MTIATRIVTYDDQETALTGFTIPSPTTAPLTPP